MLRPPANNSIIPDKEVNKLDIEFNKFVKNGLNVSSSSISFFKNLDDNYKKKYIDSIKKLKNVTKSKPNLIRLLDFQTTLNNKLLILNKYFYLSSLNPYSGEYFKLKNWIDNIMKVPFGIYKTNTLTEKSSLLKKQEYFKKAYQHMENAVYGHDEIKNKILRIIGQTITN